MSGVRGGADPDVATRSPGRFVVDPPGAVVTGRATRDPQVTPIYVRMGGDEETPCSSGPTRPWGAVLDVAAWLAQEYVVEERLYALDLILTGELLADLPDPAVLRAARAVVAGPRRPAEPDRTGPGGSDSRSRRRRC